MTRLASDRRLYPFFQFACGLLLLPLSLRALDPAKSVFQFNCQNWSRHNGLPADKIAAVAQTADGFIWLGTQHGLTRFDGLDFSVVPIALPEAKGHDVRALYAAHRGGLWFAIDQGGFGYFDGRVFTPVGDARWSQPGMSATAILERRNGAIWTGSIFGAARWVKDDPQRTFFEETFENALLLAEDPQGRVWCGAAERGLRYFEKGKWTAIADEELSRRNINALAFTPDGDIWVGTNQGLR
ncbi:MAG TPA: two-component regulator propeller domain-containing protein, partial [Opitutus sp.]|nr:two-component regulator propeller domain-containing protein [Opitutus sp.]